MTTKIHNLQATDSVVNAILDINKFYLPTDLDYSDKSRAIAIKEISSTLHSLISNNYDDINVDISYQNAFCLLYEISFLHIKMSNTNSAIDIANEKIDESLYREKKLEKRISTLTKKYEKLVEDYKILAESKINVQVPDAHNLAESSSLNETEQFNVQLTYIQGIFQTILDQEDAVIKSMLLNNVANLVSTNNSNGSTSENDTESDSMIAYENSIGGAPEQQPF